MDSLKTLIPFALASTFCCLGVSNAQLPPTATSLMVHADQKGPIINRDIFGQFAEHLGEGIYGGIWVGKNSTIPNVRGIRTDVVNALREIKVPVVRWPGGCFADQYNWRDGIGPEDRRVSTVNKNWGNVIEPNTFGTDEFMDLANQIGSEAYISINLGSSTPEQAAAWLEYMTTNLPTTLGRERAANGHPAPYRVKYLGVGNESWGCGGPFEPDQYVQRMKQYANFVKNLNPAQMSPSLLDPKYKPNPDAMKNVASAGFEFTEPIMKAWKAREPWYWNIDGVSVHSYTFGGFPGSAPAVGFDEKQYAAFLKETLAIEGLIAYQSSIMDKYDPKKQVALVMDEWGAWLKPMPDTKVEYLKQQNSLRDGILAALNINIFARHADRVRMTNIAQMVNVLQSMILTDGSKMVLTPTYEVYKMYVPFQGATMIPVNFDGGSYSTGDISLPQIDALAAKATDGHIWISLVNVDPNHGSDVDVRLQGVTAKSFTGQTLTADKVDTVNTFDSPNAVLAKPFTSQAADGKLMVHLSPKSITVVRLDD